ncbi:MAG: TorF family putative porin [Sulfuricella sp.]|nr:TorF family putative porin [Sulfuricella sp.]
MKIRNVVASLALAVATSASPALAYGDEAPALTAHVDLVSAYFLRGATTTYGNFYPGLGNSGADAPESSRPVLQWGADYAHPSGWYAGYWGSQINYSYKRLGQSYDDRAIVSGFQDNKSIENDLYGGYTGKVGDLSYTVGLTGYLYINGKHADAVETKLGLGYQEFALTAQTLLNDTVWGNQRDTYWSLGYTKALPHELTFTATLGWFTYGREGKFLGTQDTLAGTACAAGTAFVVNGCYAGNQPVGSAFRHVTLGISQPLGKTGLTWSVQGILGGENRFGVHQTNKGVASLSYSF